MKLIRVPWIQCRADEVDSIRVELDWRGRPIAVLAYSEKEARDWWGDLAERERDAVLGIGDDAPDESPSLF
jgi:hypothetical protein